MRDGTEKYIIRESTDKGMFFMCECGNVQLLQVRQSVFHQVTPSRRRRA